MGDDPEERARERVGTTLRDKWTVDRLLGVGGMAAVYSATHRNKKRAALKILHPELSTRPEFRQRFLREGYIANTVDHPGAVTVDDDDVTEDGAVFLVMELLDGRSLEEERLEAGGRLPPKLVCEWMIQLLAVLQQAHEKQIVHRDLKPENIFLQAGDRVRVLDFGIARLRELSQPSSTETGTLLGTPAFMAPEQARGRWDEVDARTDLWAVGATMFTLLTGAYVHDAETTNETLVKAVMNRAPPIQSIAPQLPASVAAAVDRSLAYATEDRFADAEEMRIELQRITHGGALDGVAAAAGSTAIEGEPAPNIESAANATTPAMDVLGETAIQSATLAPAPTERGVTTSSAAKLAVARGREWPLALVGGALLLIAGVLGAGFALTGSETNRQSTDEPSSAPATADSTDHYAESGTANEALTGAAPVVSSSVTAGASSAAPSAAAPSSSAAATPAPPQGVPWKAPPEDPNVFDKRL